MARPEVSVVVPAYNEEARIGACLEHVLMQSSPAGEIVVVNNNCQDGTVGRVMALAHHFPQIRVVHEPRQGMIPARNRGFNEAVHEVMARVDADTLAPYDWIERIQANFMAHPEIAGLVGPLRYPDAKIPLFKSGIAAKLYVHFLRRKLGGHYSLNGANMVITRNIWTSVRDEVCTNDRAVHEDIDLSIHIIKAGGYIQYDPKFWMVASARRIQHNPRSFWVEYPRRLNQTVKSHRL